MKTNLKRMFNRIVALFLVVMVLGGIPITALAETLEIKANDFLVEQADAAVSGGGGYSYTAPNEGSFLIENATGTISIINGTPVVQFAGLVVTIPAFDYYKIVDQKDNVRFYQADVLKDSTQANGFAYIGIYIEEGNMYTIHVQYGVEAEAKLYNIRAVLTEDQFFHFTQASTVLCIGTDTVSQRLKTSARIYKNGTFANYDNSLTYNNALMPAALNAAAANSYDEYTNLDGIIKEYDEEYYGDYILEDGWTITDDPIVQIIPKELCFVPGEHIYVGMEYGFFIRVINDTMFVNDYVVDIMVFDIEHTTPSFPSDTEGGSRIDPLFEYTYRASEDVPDMDPSLSCVIIPHVQYDYAEYFLKDVGFRFTLDNPTALNPGDSGYDPYEDNGAFIIQTRVNGTGVGLKEKAGSFTLDTAMFVFGFVPVVGPIVSALAYVHDVHNGFGSGNYFYTNTMNVEASDEDNANVHTYETNNTDQINARGNLIKSMSIALNSNDTNPCLIDVEEGYLDAKYVIARKSGSSYNKIRVITSISVGVFEDNTDMILPFVGRGELVSYGRATGTYETSGFKRLNDMAVHGAAYTTIPANTQTNIIKITPKISGSYKIYTSSYSGDPCFRITNATKGTSPVLAKDDISGANNRNAELTIDLIGGDIYYLEAFRYGTPNGYVLSIGYNTETTQVLSADTPYSVVVDSDSYQMLKFTPSTTGYYEIYTAAIDGDPQLLLFSSSGNLMDSDDDSGGNLDAYLECELVAGETYYIAVEGYNGDTAELSVAVSLLYY